MDVNELETALGDQVRRLRLAAGLDQTQLALQAGLSVSAVKRLESGQGNSLSTVIVEERIICKFERMIG
jgi:transcriptional regulator with XRE-family HTH domain